MHKDPRSLICYQQSLTSVASMLHSVASCRLGLSEANILYLAFLSRQTLASHPLTISEQAIAYARESHAATRVKHPGHVQGLSNLAEVSRIKCLRTPKGNDLEQTIRYAHKALLATSVDQPARAGHLNTLGLSYGYEYDRTHNLDDLEKAASYAQEGLEVTPLDHTARSGYSNNTRQMGRGLSCCTNTV